MEHVQRMALNMDPISDGSLLETDIADLKNAQLRESQKPVCPGKRVLWIHCVRGKHWFMDCFCLSADRKDVLQRVISENMLVDVGQILEFKSIWIIGNSRSIS